MDRSNRGEAARSGETQRGGNPVLSTQSSEVADQVAQNRVAVSELLDVLPEGTQLGVRRMAPWLARSGAIRELIWAGSEDGDGG